MPGQTVPAVILNKSEAGKKRARRWVKEPSMVPGPSQGFRSLQPRDEAHLLPVSITNDAIAHQTTTQPDIRDLFLDAADTFQPLQSVSVPDGPSFGDMSTTYDYSGIYGLTGGPSRALFAARSAPSASLDLNFMHFPVLLSPLAQTSQLSTYMAESFDAAMFTPLGLPERKNMAFFYGMLQDATFRQELPFAQLEKFLQSKGIVLGRSAGGPILHGCMSTSIAGILPSNHQSVLQRSTELQPFKRKLSSLLPGQSCAIVTGDQAFETNFVRMLLFSVLNGFAGLDEVPMVNFLRFLNRLFINKLLVDILRQCPRYVSRTLADNIFWAAIEDRDTKVVNLLLDRKLVDVNETVCFWDGLESTAIERATQLESLQLMRLLIDAGADVDKSYNAPGFGVGGGALNVLIDNVRLDSRRYSSGFPTGALKAFDMLIVAGAQLNEKMLSSAARAPTKELACHLSLHICPCCHQHFFCELAQNLRYEAGDDDDVVLQLFENMIALCNKADCNKCLVDLRRRLENIVMEAAQAGSLRIVQFFLDKVDFRSAMSRILTAAIISQNDDLIHFILSHNLNLDHRSSLFRIGNHYHNTTLIAEAVRYGDKDLIERFEAAGALNTLLMDGGFNALVDAAAEAGDATYMKKLLDRVVTLKEARQPGGNALAIAVDLGHRDVLQMLLEAGAKGVRSNRSAGPLDRALRDPDPRMMRALIAFGACDLYESPTEEDLAQVDPSILIEYLHEDIGGKSSKRPKVEAIISAYIRKDTVKFCKEILEIMSPDGTSLDKCLQVAVKFGHEELIGYLLDMGANPLNAQVLQAAMPDRQDVLLLLLQKDRRRQTFPKCIGVSILSSVMGDNAGNAEALESLLQTQAINFKRLEVVRKFGHFDDDFLSPLGLAIQGLDEHCETNVAAMEKFLRAGADPNGIARAETSSGPLMTALVVAVETGREDVVKILLDYGADMNARPRLRTIRTALQHAAAIGKAEMVRLLLSNGADPNKEAPPQGGATALQFAAISGNCNMLADLLDCGADLGALPSKVDGRWPLEGAAEAGRLDMIRFLWELNVMAAAAGLPYDGFSERQCLRAMNLARLNGHIGCGDLVSELSGIPIEKLETEDYGAPWIAY